MGIFTTPGDDMSIPNVGRNSWRCLLLIICGILFILVSTPLVMSQGMHDQGGYEENEPNPWADVVGLTFCCLIPIGLFALSIWVYKDAEARGKSGVGWLIIAILTYGLGTFIWFIVRPKEKLVDMPGYIHPQQYYYQPPYQPSPAYAPPAPAPRQASPRCSECGNELKYIEEYNRWYCEMCMDYEREF